MTERNAFPEKRGKYRWKIRIVSLSLFSKKKKSLKKKCNLRKSQFVFGRVENMMGKGENAGYQHFHLFP